jgi:hypothetical protein
MNHSSNIGKYLNRSLGLALVIIFGVLSILGSGGGSDDTSSNGTTPNEGWVTITYPTSNNTDNSPQYISGEAFISPTWWRCCSGDASDTGVTVIWSNETTGQTAQASQYVSICWFLWSPYLCNHTWSANIPVIEGNNLIAVTAFDPSGNTGTDRITIIRSPDSIPPSVFTTSPADGATNIDPSTSVLVTFSESIQPTTVNNNSFIIKSFAGSQIDGDISVLESGAQATFKPSNNFVANGTYTATLTTDITDLSGIPLSEAYIWTFETGEGDTVAPTIITTSPLPGSTDVSLNASIKVTFSELMHPLSITTDTFILFDATNNRINGVVSPSGSYATFAPSSPLQQNSLYTAMVTTGVTDYAGNSLENDYSWSFITTIPDTNPPTVINSSPSDNETGVAIDGSLFIEFSENMDINSINDSTFLLKDSSGNPISGTISGGDTFKPFANLELNETYTATITTAVTDLAGNPLAQPFSWNFTTTEDGIGTWVATSTINTPSPRIYATAVWTGQEMLVWGGSYLNTGGRYNPTTDSWKTISTVNAPNGCYTPVSVWTGQEMIVYCGGGGGRYNPATDTWSSMSTINIPMGLKYTIAVWTGSEMIVWGGYSSTYSNRGGRYNPSTDTWQPTSLIGAPVPRMRHTAIWTGSEMIVWGGDGGPFVNIGDTGGRYEPVTDSWRDIASSGFLNNKVGHVATWTGSEMVVWNGNTNSGSYNPVTDSWSHIATLNALIERYSPSSAWTGEQMIIWGGKLLSSLNSGGSYNPTSDNWILMTFTAAPTGRSECVSVWTGTEFIVWGGRDWSGALTNTGGRYRYP